jgi:hypothetical protein
MGVLRSPWGAVAQKFGQDSPLFLPRRRHDALKQGNAVFMRSFTLPVGRYSLETAAMDRQTGRKTVERSRLVVPETTASLALSSLAVVKRTEQVPKGALASEDPFRLGDVRIVPWVTEAQLAAGQDPELFLVAYASPDLRTPPELLLEFVRDGKVVSRAAPALPPPDPQGRIPYVVNVSATHFSPGEYEVRAELKSGPNRAWEHCSFRVVAPASGGLSPGSR